MRHLVTAIVLSAILTTGTGLLAALSTSGTVFAEEGFGRGCGVGGGSPNNSPGPCGGFDGPSPGGLGFGGRLGDVSGGGGGGGGGLIDGIHCGGGGGGTNDETHSGGGGSC